MIAARLTKRNHYHFIFSFNPNNVLGIRSFADTLGCTQLTDAADEYIQQHFHEVSVSDEFLSMNGSELLDIVKKDELHINSEEQVSFRFVMTKAFHKSGLY